MVKMIPAQKINGCANCPKYSTDAISLSYYASYDDHCAETKTSIVDSSIILPNCPLQDWKEEAK